ncbi:MAG: chromosome segregation ATPase [Leptolyngbya sp. SIO4C1]|nr:chromosome segregation ATPase [Leptolyngbya sp. SIO4C1]
MSSSREPQRRPPPRPSSSAAANRRQPSRVPDAKGSQPQSSTDRKQPSFPKFQQAVPTASAEPVEPAEAKPSQPSPLRWLLQLRWLRSWQFLLLSTVAVLSGTTAFAAISLFRIPNLPNCRAIFWPTASASLRLQCAESYAEQGTVEFLLDAIDLVDHLPDDHPLRGEINQRIEGWSDQILALADRSFQSGELDMAIATVRQIPAQTAAADAVEGRIRSWRKIWSEASEIFEAAKKQLSERNFQEAFSLSVKLIDIGNSYWEETKYNELTKLIALAREDSGKLGKAEQLAKRGSLDGFQEALKLIDSIGQDSVLHAEAQKVKKDVIKDMLRLAEVFLERQKLSQSERLLRAIPRGAGFDQQVADFQVFVDAYQRAWAGDALGLDAAVTRLQSLGKERPLYARAQMLIRRWRSELQALAQLDQARQLAANGNVADLNSAITAAQAISRSNPRWEEASQQIRRWRSRVETIEDQPILNRADQLASPGTPDSLRAAIQEVRKIRSGRALSEQADTRVRNWRRRIQQIEDRPILEQARSQAAVGNLTSAITTASRIGSGRVLYDEAQADISDWQIQNQSKQWLRDAYSAAESGSSSGLANAISIADQIPERGDNYREAQTQIDRWSWDLLNAAETSALSDLARAIAIAQDIPSGADAYDDAQQRIAAWQAEQDLLEQPLELAPPERAEELPEAPSPE